MCKGGLSFREITAHMGRNATTVIHVWKRLIEQKTPAVEHTIYITSPRDDRHLIRIAVMKRMTSSRALTQRCSTATGVSLSVPHDLSTSATQWVSSKDLSALNSPRVESPGNRFNTCRAGWQQFIFSDESRYGLHYNDGRVVVKSYRDAYLGVPPGVSHPTSYWTKD